MVPFPRAGVMSALLDTQGVVQQVLHSFPRTRPNGDRVLVYKGLHKGNLARVEAENATSYLLRLETYDPSDPFKEVWLPKDHVMDEDRAKHLRRYRSATPPLRSSTPPAPESTSNIDTSISPAWDPASSVGFNNLTKDGMQRHPSTSASQPQHSHWVFDPAFLGVKLRGKIGSCVDPVHTEIRDGRVMLRRPYYKGYTDVSLDEVEFLEADTHKSGRMVVIHGDRKGTCVRAVQLLHPAGQEDEYVVTVIHPRDGEEDLETGPEFKVPLSALVQGWETGEDRKNNQALQKRILKPP